MLRTGCLIGIMWICVQFASAMGMQSLASPSSTIEQYGDVDYEELYRTAKQMIHENKPDSALMLYSILIKSPQRYNHAQLLASSYNNAGYLYFYEYAEYDKAYQYWIKALELDEKYDLLYRETVLLNLANIFSVMEDQEKAADYYKKAFDLAAEKKSYLPLMTIYNNLMLSTITPQGVYKRLPFDVDYDFMQVPDTIPMKKYCINLQKAFADISVGRNQNAIAWLDSAFSKIDIIYTPDRYQVGVVVSQARLYNGMGKVRAAIGKYLIADSISKANEQYDYIVEINKKLAELYATLGQQDSAQMRLHTAYAMQDSVFNLKLINNIHHIETLSEVDKVSEKMVEIDHQRRVQQIVLIFLLAILSLGIGSLVWIATLYRRERAKSNALYEKNVQMMSLQPATAPSVEPKYSKSALSDDLRDELLPKIKELLEGQEVLNSDFGNDYIAERIGTNPRYVSQIINEAYGQSISAVVLERRIREACRLLSENSNKYTIETISAAVGYKSRSSFSKAFQKVTGLSPSEFQKHIAK